MHTRRMPYEDEVEMGWRFQKPKNATDGQQPTKTPGKAGIRFFFNLWKEQPCLQNCERIHFCCLSHPICGIVTAALLN